MTVSAAMKAHLALEITTLTTCWKVTRKDAFVLAFTEFDSSIIYDGVTYLPAHSFAYSSITSTDSLNVDNLEINSALTDATVTDADILAALWDGAAVEIFKVNWADLSMGTIPLRSGTMGEIKTGRNSFNAELRGLTQPLQQTVGRIHSISCDADLGDVRCAKSLTAFTFTVAVTSVTDQSHFAATALTQAAGYFDHGKLTFTSGLNSGIGMEVKTQAVGGVIALQMSMPFAVAVGNTFTVVAGCDKIVDTCVGRFNNAANFRGFPSIPGLDSMVSGK